VPVYIVHLSAQRALERVMEARDRGLPAYAETCPQYLFCSEDDLRGAAGRRLGRAPVTCARRRCARKHHHEHLWRGLRNYDLQCVATDHCPFCMKARRSSAADNFAKIPNGMPGIETRLYLLWEGVRAGKISMNRFVEITATAPAKIFGLYPRRARSPSAATPTSWCGIPTA
jgi:dihydropyrimidinase